MWAFVRLRSTLPSGFAFNFLGAGSLAHLAGETVVYSPLFLVPGWGTLVLTSTFLFFARSVYSKLRTYLAASRSNADEVVNLCIGRLFPLD